MIEGGWYPQTEQETELLEDIHVVTRLAASEGVNKARIASLLAYMASAAAQQAAFEDGGADAGSAQESTEAPPMGPPCPKCQEPVLGIGGGLGEAIAEPCECRLDPAEHDELIREVGIDD